MTPALFIDKNIDEIEKTYNSEFERVTNWLNKQTFVKFFLENKETN